MTIPCIYALVDPRTQAVRYIGKALNLASRLRMHRYSARTGRRTHKDTWLRALLKNGLWCLVRILEEVSKEDRKYLGAIEREWVTYGRRMNWPLTNLTGGGDGVLGLRHPCSEETKRKISTALRGRKLSKETRARMSIAREGRKFSEETRAKMSEAAKRRSPCSVETRAKMSAKHKGKVVSPVAREHMGAARRGVLHWTYKRRKEHQNAYEVR